MRKLSLVIVGIMLLATMGGACNGINSTTTYQVKYVVSGQPAMAELIMYTDKYGHAPRLTNVSLPWTYTFEATEGKYVSLYAQSGYGYENSSITVTIYKDGKVIKTRTNTGNHCIAWVSDTL